MKDCKYRLPCLWCDKYDRVCDLVQWELNKNNNESNKENNHLEPCKEHNWEYITSKIGYPNYDFYRCTQCGVIKQIEV